MLWAGSDEMQLTHKASRRTSSDEPNRAYVALPAILWRQHTNNDPKWYTINAATIHTADFSPLSVLTTPTPPPSTRVDAMLARRLQRSFDIEFNRSLSFVRDEHGVLCVNAPTPNTPHGTRRLLQLEADAALAQQTQAKINGSSGKMKRTASYTSH